MRSCCPRPQKRDERSDAKESRTDRRGTDREMTRFRIRTVKQEPRIRDETRHRSGASENREPGSIAAIEHRQDDQQRQSQKQPI